MSILKMNLPAETTTQPIFILYGIPYMPSYVEKHRWIGPGNTHTSKTYTTTELVASGARLSTMDLWERFWTKEVKGWRVL